MKKALLFLFCFLLAIESHTGSNTPSTWMQVLDGSSAPATGPSTIFSWDYEAGIQASWVPADSGSAVSWNYATSPAPLAGTYSGYYFPSNASTWYLTNLSGGPFSELYGYCLVNVQQATTSSGTLFAGFYPAGLVALYWNGDGRIEIVDSGGGSATTTSALTDGITYHLWWHWQSGAKIDVAFSTTTTRPTSGNSYAEDTSSIATGTVSQLLLGSQNRSVDPLVIFDNVILTTGGYYQP